MPSKPGDELLSPAQLAAEVGVDVTTIYKWNSKGLAPKRHRLTGRCVRYKRSDVNAWLRDKLELDATGLDAGEQ